MVEVEEGVAVMVWEVNAIFSHANNSYMSTYFSDPKDTRKKIEEGKYKNTKDLTTSIQGMHNLRSSVTTTWRTAERRLVPNALIW